MHKKSLRIAILVLFAVFISSLVKLQNVDQKIGSELVWNFADHKVDIANDFPKFKKIESLIKSANLNCYLIPFFDIPVRLSCFRSSVFYNDFLLKKDAVASPYYRI